MATLLVTQLCSQSLDTNFFPNFTPYTQNPVINYGDDLIGSPWNDPTVLKENGQYIMYTSGVQGGLNHPTDTISIYRWLSSDGYSWSLNPTLPVLEPVAGTYYEGGVETPSVVFYKGEYHMYNTIYVQNNAYDFKISHATSLNGITWQIDSSFILEPASNLTWMDTIVAEPGVMVKDDTLYLFYTAASSLGGFRIGLVRSLDGHNFIDTTLTATLPTDVYQNGNNYVGLSTPSPILIGDTIYLFTDVAQNVFGNNWMQVALHQFKSYGDITKWHHDSVPIHTRSDFPWTNGNYLAEIRSITPLLDGNRLRIWYAGHNIANIDTVRNDTTYNLHFIGNELHVDSGYWAIGTSEFIFTNPIGINETAINQNISILYYENNGIIETRNQELSTIKVYAVNGQLLFEKEFTGSLHFNIEYYGLVFINVINGNSILTKKCFSF